MARSPCSSDRLEVELAESGCNDARERDARRYREEREAFRSRQECPADDGPSEEDMRQAQLQRIQDTLDVLQTRETGPALIRQSYLAGETKPLGTWVVPRRALLRGRYPERRRAPVEKAVDLLGGVV